MDAEVLDYSLLVRTSDAAATRSDVIGAVWFGLARLGQRPGVRVAFVAPLADSPKVIQQTQEGF